MKNFLEPLFFYKEAIDFIDLSNYEGAINVVRKNLELLDNYDDISLAYLNCGFLYNKLRDFVGAIEALSKCIYYESKIDFLDGRSKDLSFCCRSNSRYQIGDFKGAIEDKREARKIRKIETKIISDLNNSQIHYKSLLMGTYIGLDLIPKYELLVKSSRIDKNKYDLIEDYKKVISNERKDEVIKKLEILSESRYKVGDYKGSIKAIRRAEKYY